MLVKNNFMYCYNIGYNNEEINTNNNDDNDNANNLEFPYPYLGN